MSSLRRDLRASTADAACYSFMVGSGETYLPAFVLAVGWGGVSSGLIATVPMLAGAILQLVSPAAVHRLGSHRRWVLLCASVQAMSFVPLFVGALMGAIPLGLLFVSAAAYWGAGMATGPAWNTWMGSLVPRRVRARYFGRRARFASVGTLIGFLIGGFVLSIGSRFDVPLRAFAALFVLASVCRVLSTLCLASQREPNPLPSDHRIVSPGELFTRICNGDGRLLVYLLYVQTAVQIAGPYFTPFMLGQLRLSYVQYVTIVASALVAKIVVTPALGLVAHRLGASRLMWIGGIGIVPLAASWVVTDSFPYLVVIQIGSGTAWAAYELAMMLLFFETIPARERTSVLTAYNLANAFAMSFGSIIGGALLVLGGGTRSAYLLLFLVSSVARLFSLGLLGRVSRVDFVSVPIATRTIAVRPSAGSIDRPVLPSLSEDESRAPVVSRPANELAA